jgi:hypothetical protein
MSFSTQRTSIILLTGLTTLAPGCGSENDCLLGEPVTTTEVLCAPSASVTVTMPDSSTLRARVVAVGQSCMDENRACTATAVLRIIQISTNTDPYVVIAFDLSVPAGATPSYELPAPALAISAGLFRQGDPSYQPISLLSVVAGRLAVEANTTSELRVTIEMTLETAAHERYVLSNGSASVSGCQLLARTECRLS